MPPSDGAAASVQVPQDFEDLLEYVKTNRGFDFTGYKRPSLLRRVSRRLEALRLPDHAAYRAYLEEHPDEFVELFDSILINVTSFFRDLPTWDYLAHDVVPRIAAQSDGQLRVWSTGCATGEEAYTIAMLLAEEMGEEAFRQRVKIYATDVDDAALSQGRHGVFPARALEPVPQELRDRYFERADRGYAFRKELRRSVIFGKNDLVQDPPISRIDLLAARNTLMYFNPDTQQRVLANFHFALKPTGYLVLGKSELLLTRSNLLVPVNLKRRVFQRSHDGAARLRPAPANDLADTLGEGEVSEAAFEAASSAQVVVGADGVLAYANNEARALFALSLRDVGRSIQDLELSYRPLELRSVIEQAYLDGHPINVRDVEWRRSSDDARVLDVHVTPLRSRSGELIGTDVTFMDVTRYRRLQESLEQTNNELETAYEELQATAEELETTNEELQSTNEELETTNEELQSTNEELETMNEELQSTNEELETMNSELQRSGDELNAANAFLESILTSLRGGVVVLDRELQVLAWNPEATELWGLRSDEVRGQHFLNLDLGLPVDELHRPIRACLAGERHVEVSVAATNRRGTAIVCDVTCSQLRAFGGGIEGVILQMESRPPSGS